MVKLADIPGIRFSFDGPDLPETPGLVRCRQVHGKEVLVVTADNIDVIRPSAADGLITRASRPVGIQTADCLPVLFSSKDGKVVAAVHAGWRGVQQGILPVAVGRFGELGVLPRDLVVAIGPAIGRCCFEVSPEVVAQFEEQWGSLWKGMAEKPWRKERPPSADPARTQAVVHGGDHWLDLDRIARLQLERAGVPASQVEDVGACTYCGPGELASYRRGTHIGIKAGRQWAWIAPAR